MGVTRCQGEFLHSSGCVASVPLVCRSRSIRIEWAREDLSDQELPIMGAALSARKSLPCASNAHEWREYLVMFAFRPCPLLVRFSPPKRSKTRSPLRAKNSRSHTDRASG